MTDQDRLSSGKQDGGQLIELCNDAVLLVQDGRVMNANPAGLALLGASGRQALRNLMLSDLFPDGAGMPSSAAPRMLHRLDGSAIAVKATAVSLLPEKGGGSMLILQQAANKASAKSAQRKNAESARSAAGAGTAVCARHVSETAPALLAYIQAAGSDGDERYGYVNSASQSWFGRPQDNVAGSTLREVHGADFALIRPYLAQALAGQPVRFDCTLQGPRGNRRAAVAFAPDMTAEGTVRGASLVAMEIAERRAMDNPDDARGKRRSQSRALRQLRLITDSVPVFIAQCDRDYRLRFVNRTYAGQLGIEPEQMIGRRIPDIVGDEVFAQYRGYLDAALTGSAQEHEVTLPLPPGSERRLHMMVVPEIDSTGAIHGIIAAISDISRLRHAEEQLYRREREFKTLVESSPDAIMRIDRGMRHIYASPAIEAMTGVPAASFLGKTKADLGLPDEVVRAWDDAVRAALESGAEQRFDFHMALRGEPRFYSARVLPEMDGNGRSHSALGIVYDVTDRKRMESEHRELLERERAARIQAETAARVRDEFLSVVSHELRAPLNGIQTWAHVLENYVKESGPLTRRAIAGIKTGVTQQVRLIDDLLDATRMLSGRLRLVRQPFALLPVLQAAVESVQASAAAKRIALHCDYRIGDQKIDGDPDRMQQVIWNLLDNAVKFTRDGGNIWVSATGADGQAAIEVRDDGMGIAPQLLPHLFDRFTQQDSSSTRRHAGLGLGLFLVRHLTEMHGGSVSASSEGEGRGSAFVLRLPLRARMSDAHGLRASGVEGGEALPSLKGLRILLIDDQQEVRDAMSILLTNAGSSVFAAGTTQEVFGWLGTLAPDRLPHILVCDIAMPEEDGYTVLRRLRSWQTPDGTMALQKMPALALTAFAQREDRIKALTAGFQMHMAKPVAPEELIVAIAMMATRG